MFKQLEELSKRAKLIVTIETNKNGIMDVLVSFDLKDKKERSINLTPIPFTGKAEELDIEFPVQIKLLTEGAVDTLERINFFIKSLKDVADAKVDEAAGKKTTTKVVTPPKKKETNDLFATANRIEVENKLCDDDSCEVEDEDDYNGGDPIEEEFEMEEMTTDEIIAEVEKETKPLIASTPRPQTAVVTGTLTNAPAPPVLDEQAQLIQDEFDKAQNKEIVPIINFEEEMVENLFDDVISFEEVAPPPPVIETEAEIKQRLFDEMMELAKQKGMSTAGIVFERITIATIENSIQHLKNKK